MDINLLDIDDPGNGLLLWKPIEHAFDTSALSFIYHEATDRYALLGSVGKGSLSLSVPPFHTWSMICSQISLCPVAALWPMCWIRACGPCGSATGAQSSWVPSGCSLPPSSRAANLTFADIDGTTLSFPPGCLQRPMKRVLCYQAHLAKQHAAEVGWLQLDFDDFWSEDLPYVDKVKAWLGISG